MIVSSLYEFETGAIFYRIVGLHCIRKLVLVSKRDHEIGHFLDITELQNEYNTQLLNRNELYNTREDAILQACKNLEKEILNLRHEAKQNKRKV